MRFQPNNKYNKVLTGIIVGLLLPFIGYAILLLIYDQIDIWILENTEGVQGDFRERTIGLIAIILNVIPLQFFYKKYWDNAMRGIVFPTLLFVGLWMYFYGFELLNQ